jgi:hypothetical protein
VTTSIDSIDDMAVYQGALYAITGKTNSVEVYRYNGGTGAAVFQVINSVVGGMTVGTDNADGGLLQVFDGKLYIAERTGSDGKATLYTYTGAANATQSFTDVNSTHGRLAVTTGMQDITAMAVYDGALFIAATKGNGTAEVYRFTAGTTSPSVQQPLVQLNSTPGELDTTVDTTANIRAVTSMRAYNGRLYVGTDTTGGAQGAVYQYDPTLTNNFSVTLLGSNTGVYASDTGISAVGTMVEFNGTMYVGTSQASKGAVYSWTNTQTNSFALKFDPGFTNANYGSISFVGNTETQSDQAHTGSFIFSNAIALASGGFDYAEDYPTNDTSLSPGEIVAVDPGNAGYVKRADSTSAALGIISENPGFDLKQTADKAINATYVPVALNGRVPVKVSTENGEIKPGDLLTVSSTPGVAMKATRPGFVIARALEGYAANDTSAVGKIIVFVNLTWADPSVQLTASGDLNIANTLPTAIQALPSGQLPLATQVDLPLSVTASATVSSSSSAALSLTTLNDTVMRLQSQFASLSGQMTKIDDLSRQILDLQKTVNLGAVLGSSASASLTDNTTVGGPLNVLGKAVLSDLGVTGKINTGLLTIDGMDANASGSATINTLSGPLKLQPLALGGVDFLNGKIIIDTAGNLSVSAAITAKKYNVDTTDVEAASLGEAIIPADKSKIEVTTTAVTDASKIFVTAESLITEPLTVTKKTKGLSFTVEIAAPVKQDVKFNWWIVN